MSIGWCRDLTALGKMWHVKRTRESGACTRSGWLGGGHAMQLEASHAPRFLQTGGAMDLSAAQALTLLIVEALVGEGLIPSRQVPAVSGTLVDVLLTWCPACNRPGMHTARCTRFTPGATQ